MPSLIETGLHPKRRHISFLLVSCTLGVSPLSPPAPISEVGHVVVSIRI